jgi:hypothetical protein
MTKMLKMTQTNGDTGLPTVAEIDRRSLLKMTGNGIAALGLAAAVTGPATAQPQVERQESGTRPSPRATRSSTRRSPSRPYGITLAGDLYRPKMPVARLRRWQLAARSAP